MKRIKSCESYQETENGGNKHNKIGPKSSNTLTMYLVKTIKGKIKISPPPFPNLGYIVIWREINKGRDHHKHGQLLPTQLPKLKTRVAGVI
jgi:hypothetical protein